MSKALKSNNKLLVNGGKLVTPSVDILGAGYGTKKYYFMRNGKIVTTASGLPYSVLTLSPVMSENTLAEIGNAIKHYREIGLPWEYGSQIKVKYVPFWEDNASHEDYNVKYETTVTLVGDCDVNINGADGHGYTFALPLNYYTAVWYTSSFLSWEGWSSHNFSFADYYSDFNDGEWEEQDINKALYHWGSSIISNNNFGVASLRDVSGTSKDRYYDTFHAIYGTETVMPSRSSVSSVFANLPSYEDFFPTMTNTLSDVIEDGVTYRAFNPSNKDLSGMNLDWLKTDLQRKMEHILNVDGVTGASTDMIRTRSLVDGLDVSSSQILGRCCTIKKSGNGISPISSYEYAIHPDVIFFVVQATYD